MRTPPDLMSYALPGTFACCILPALYLRADSTVPLSVGIVLAAFLGMAAVAFSRAGYAEPPLGEWRRRSLSRSLTTSSRTNAVLFWTNVPVALLNVGLSRWTLSPLLAVAVALAVASHLQRRRERLDIRALAAEGRLTGPKIIGLRDARQVPRGWVPLLVHREAGTLRDHFADHRVTVDGDHVGWVGPGEELVVGLPPGPHTVRLRLGSLSGDPVRIVAEPGKPVRLLADQGEGGPRSVLGWWRSPEARLRLVRAPEPVHVSPPERDAADR
ncbi:hypothetical protein [Nocardiopsis algeriensis]|uniref:Uncharacterized protein n=1 Tax=Nocardiopsis algeriensis TaxID=1478215 RepID=A0A841IQQ7_9ACTN|nr:hypothetical protein [Nocardiopsis algeriensis]MBB6119606.1 hypothetical protein [Nocardiopsis algeriensis]